MTTKKILIAEDNKLILDTVVFKLGTILFGKRKPGAR